MRPLRPAVVVGLLALDRVTKIWAAGSLKAAGTIPLIPFFDLTYVENTGAAFGLGRGANIPLVLISIGLVIGLEVMSRRWPKTDPWLGWGKVLVIAGAIGNLYDRVAFGFVVDFLHIHHWPVFNVADSCITVGAAMLAWGMRDEPSPAAARR